MNISTKTIEFRVDATIPSDWLDDLTRVWNDGLHILNWNQHYQRAIACNALDLPPHEIRVHKVGADWVFYSPIGRDQRIDRTKSWDKHNVEFRHCCQLVHPHWLTPPPIDGLSAIALRKPFAKKRCDWLAQSSIPSVYVNDFIGVVLFPAWQQYLKGVRAKPRYKRHPVSTISSESFRGQVTAKGDNLKLPGLGSVKVTGYTKLVAKPLEELCQKIEQDYTQFEAVEKKLTKLIATKARKVAKAESVVWDEEKDARLQSHDPQDFLPKIFEYYRSPGAFKILERDGKTYLQLSYFAPVSSPKSDREVAIASGIDYLAVTTHGAKVRHQDLQKLEAKLDKYRQLLSSKQRGSNNYKKLLSKKRKLERRLAETRQKYQQYVAAWTAKSNGEITQYTSELKPVLSLPAVRPIKTDESLEYGANGATVEHERNNKIKSLAIGQFRALVKQQAQKHGRIYQECDNIDSSPFCAASDSKSPNTEGDKGKPREKASSNSQSKPKNQVPSIARVANQPKEPKTKRRNRSREKAIG